MKLVVTIVLVLAFLVAGATIAFAQDSSNASEACFGSGIGCTEGDTCDEELTGAFCLDSDRAQACGRTGGGCGR